MPQYGLERIIPPSEVTIDFLKQLERVLLDDIASWSTLSSEERQRGYSIEITDAFGTETLKTIDAYRPSLFPDTTTAVVVKLLLSQYGVHPTIYVRLSFNLRSIHSVFKVDVEDDNAREIAMGLADRLHQSLAPQRRAHRFFHPRLFGWAMRAFLAMGAVITPPYLSITGIIPYGQNIQTHCSPTGYASTMIHASP